MTTQNAINKRSETLTLDAVTAPSHAAGQLFYDTDTDSLSFHNSESGITLQVGEESWIKVRNETGATITNGTIVHLSGASSDMPLIIKAQANAESTQRTLGVVTHSIENNSNGFITTFGLVRGLNTSGFSGGEIIYLSPATAGGVTTTKPSNSDWIVRLGYIANVGTTDGSFLVTIENSGAIEDLHGYTNDSNGFLDPDDDVEISFVEGTRTFTIAPQATSFAYWSEGVRYDKTSSEDIVIADTEGLHYIYYNEDTLTETTTFSSDLILKYAFVSIVHWDATNSLQIYIADEFKHTTKMGSKTHQYLHDTVGFALESGGGLTDILVDESGDLASHAQFGVEATEAYDEDAKFSFTARGSTETIPLYYKTGVEASNIWRIDETASYGVLTTGTGRAAYNELTGGSWQQTEVTNNDFVLAHVFTYNDSIRKFGVIQGEADYNTISAARDGAETEISNITLAGAPFEEFKFLGTIIYQTSNGYANAVQSRIRSTDTGDDYVDLRDFGITRGGVSGTLTDHGALTGLLDDDHSQYLLADGTRNLSGAWNMASQALTNVNIDGGSVDGTTVGANSSSTGVFTTVGIGTSTVPHGGVGVALLAIEGDDSGADGPNVQFTTDSDDYPLFQINPYAHDEINLYFDSYFNGTTNASSDAGSNFRVRKKNDALKIDGASGVSQGGIVSFSNFWNCDASGHITMPMQSAFLAYNSATDANVTGNGTDFTCSFNSEIFDQNGDYNSSTYTYTAPISMKMAHFVELSFYNTSGTTIFDAWLATSNRTYRIAYHGDISSQGVTKYIACNAAHIVDYDAGDTGVVHCSITGLGSDSVAFQGNPGCLSSFGGSIIC